EVLGEINKYGSFVSDAGGGAFLWEFSVTIPGMKEDQKADYYWYIMDYMNLLNADGYNVGRTNNDANLATVTATYKGSTFEVPCIQEATDSDMFAWDNAWTASADGIDYGQEFMLLCRCQCDEKNCQFWNGDCGEYWYDTGDGTHAQNGFCQCWTADESITFTFVYKTTDLSMIEQYGLLGYKLQNVAELYYKPIGSTLRAMVSDSQATVPIPNLFKKELTHDFDGYTAHYRVTVNESKIVLTDGSPLTIHDVMTSTLAYISGSLVITTEDANGNISTLRQGVDYTVSYDGTGDQTDELGNEVHVLDIVIQYPQPVMYILDYDTTLILPEQVTGGIKYNNSASITLWGDKITDPGIEKIHADINIAAKNYQVEIFKTCSLTNAPLVGATFGLYNEKGGLITTGVTDSDGKLLFQTNITEGIILREHVLYYLQELRPPTGYCLDDTQHWFCFCDKAGSYCEKCNTILKGTDAARIPFDQLGTTHIVNEPLHTELPSTGAAGTPIYILLGPVIILATFVYGFRLRRKCERRLRQ
ncbi:MAG: hypothetical protein IKY46_07795, partial [Clostridia bacterium]|nr:hypothetical protein [Clostridia bacterium]